MNQNSLLSFRARSHAGPILVTLLLAFLLLHRPQRAWGKVRPGEFFTFENAATSPSVTYAPLLNNDPASAAFVSSFLTSNQGADRPLAVRVRVPLTNAAALAVFDNFPVEYVFCDFFGATRVDLTKDIAEQVLQSERSQRASVGNFNIYPNGSIDPSLPAVLPPSAPRFQFKPSNDDYHDQRGVVDGVKGKQVAVPSLMPGGVDYRNPANGNSAAPNVRSALFTLPIQRLTLAQVGVLGFDSIPEGAQAHNIPNILPSSAKQLVPVISRFNNFGNNALDSDGNSSNGYFFVQNAATPSNGQLLSRGDFSAMILHYRMRGADSVGLFGGSSVVGYSPAQTAADIDAGWNGSDDANDIFKRRNYSFANLNNTIGDQGAESDRDAPRSTELSGAVWSGVYDRPGPNSRRLVILISNMSNVQRVIDFPKIGGLPLKINSDPDDKDNRSVVPGEHRALSFGKVGETWKLLFEEGLFLDNNRNGVGTGSSDPP